MIKDCQIPLPDFGEFGTDINKGDETVPVP